MAKKKRNNRKNRSGIVFSTDPDYNYTEYTPEVSETLPNQQQHLIVKTDRKGRGGKVVTLVEGFVGTEEDLKAMGKMLKSRCGVGGSQKDGVVIIQGDFKEKIYQILIENGYKAKKSG